MGTRKVFYINLDRREDRRQEIMTELNQLGWSSERLPAIPGGAKGCSASHIAILKKAIQKQWPYVVVLEDDVTFYDPTEVNRFLRQGLKATFDVLLLTTGCAKTKRSLTDDLRQVTGSQTTSAYVVRRHYYPILLKNFEEGLDLLKKLNQPRLYSLDQYWKILQAKDTWLAPIKPLGKQRASFSDIENRMVAYGN